MLVNLVEGRKAGQGLPLQLSSLRRADFQTLLNGGFERLVEQQLAKDLAVVDDQHLIAWSGTGIVSPIELLLGFFPTEGNPSYTTLDTFSDGALWALRTAIVSLTQAVHELETKKFKKKGRPSDIVICQHIGPEEGDYANYVFQSFTQYHLHIFLNEVEGNKLTHFSKSLRNGLVEPFASVIADVVAHSKLDMVLDSRTATLLFADHSTRFSINHLRNLAKCMVIWKKAWDELASCFTTFRTDNWGRFIPSFNSVNFDNFIQKYQLSSQSVRLLLFLKNHLQSASEETAPWSWISKGIYGSLSILYHASEDTWSIRLVPRSRVTDYRTLVMSGNRVQVFDKDRSKQYHPDEERGYINNQVTAMDVFKELFDQITPLVVLLVLMSGPEPFVE